MLVETCGFNFHLVTGFIFIFVTRRLFQAVRNGKCFGKLNLLTICSVIVQFVHNYKLYKNRSLKLCRIL